MKSTRPSAQGFSANRADTTHNSFVSAGDLPPTQDRALLSLSSDISATLDVPECLALDAHCLVTEVELWPLHSLDDGTSLSQALSDNTGSSPLFCERDQKRLRKTALSENLTTRLVDTHASLPRERYFPEQMELSRGDLAGLEISSMGMGCEAIPTGFEYSLIGGDYPTGKKESHIIIREIVCEAAADFTVVPRRDAVTRSYKRRSLSQVVETCFDLSSVAHDRQTHLLHGFITSFFENFHDLWPISWRQGFDYDSVEPFLYLAMTSIGAMYSGSSHAAAYGMAVYQELRPILLNACLTCPETPVKTEEIFEAILLTEIMSLYLGRFQESKYIREASTLLVSYAQRIKLFSELPDQRGLVGHCDGNQSEESLFRWIRMERRRRLAFAFLQCETYSSILFHTRPLVSHRDFDLKIPCSQELWTYVGPDWREKMLTASQAANSHTLYADLVHTATDGTFGNSAALDATSSELILCGLQMLLREVSEQNSHSIMHSTLAFQMMNPQHHSAFLFAADGMAQQHLSPRSWTSIPYSDQSSSSSASSHFVSSQNIYPADYQQACQSLNNWRTIQEVLDLISPPHTTRPAPWLLYHIGCINLHADINALQTLFGCSGESRNQAETQTAEKKIMSWASSYAAKVALHHAYQIWQVVETNLQRNEINNASNSNHNRHILPIISLYYAGMIMRAMADLYPEGEAEIWSPENPGAGSAGFCLPRGNIYVILKNIGAIAPKMSPMWEPVSALILKIQILSLSPMPTPWESNPGVDIYQQPDRLGLWWTGNLGNGLNGLDANGLLLGSPGNEILGNGEEAIWKQDLRLN
ncbi:uncharacterized protein CDV56_103912 [Aspergillus thermomutatus]|uniref:Xylanolytic transcriptional activator regulatory domain-containing protein n=1 Tax=Aspergillus thermomutatus TaxID=41047 RepID=A0A397GHF4_ASPTH|nr:uncharacterized protein CDV56_103912 [Aspergillus thermomutatus]RHZ50381.1 hypothetical protein CDV56_103912 [Aspergillus thermomutatus]